MPEIASPNSNTTRDGTAPGVQIPLTLLTKADEVIE